MNKKEPSVKEFRHKFEMPLLILGYILTIAVSILGVLVISLGGELSSFVKGALLGIISPVLGIVFVRYTYFKTVVNGIEVKKNQFSELYEIYQKLAIEMGFDKIPKLYIVNGNGTFNAYASKCSLNKKYVVLYSDLVDVAYVNKNFKFVKFVLAHELGHIKCGHINLRRIMVNPVMTVIFLSKSLTRAQEYTADRVALYYSSEEAEEMIYLYAGKNLGGNVNIDEYIKSVEELEKALFVKIINFMSDHAVGFRRMKVIRESREKGWNVHGKML